MLWRSSRCDDHPSCFSFFTTTWTACSETNRGPHHAPTPHDSAPPATAGPGDSRGSAPITYNQPFHPSWIPTKGRPPQGALLAPMQAATAMHAATFTPATPQEPTSSKPLPPTNTLPTPLAAAGCTPSYTLPHKDQVHAAVWSPVLADIIPGWYPGIQDVRKPAAPGPGGPAARFCCCSCHSWPPAMGPHWAHSWPPPTAC